MLTAITSSQDLAHLLNTCPPATAEDAAETPRDWTDGIWLAGTVYPLDPQATTDTRAVLADGTAAAEWSPHGTFCRGDHRTGNEFRNGHWCVADIDTWTATEEARGVVRDWRRVHIWDSNGFSDITVYGTVEQAKAAFSRERDELEELTDQLNADTIVEDTDY